ncbi:unnamed protein product [marine sediment metagenome]|uniref:Uncharacterized protein n=1 Tax=marine sediment metagenome TaxID=412755 RepID=X1RQC6_9ZZZZ
MSGLKTAKFVGGFEAQTKSAVMEGIITVACPHCGEERQIEPDGFYPDIECEGCGKHYRTVGII